MANINFFLLTGDPGVGKTTLTRKLVTELNKRGVKTSGFITEEVRKNSVREGFDVVNLQGERGSLARDQNLINGPIKCKVGKYGVLVQDFERVALPSLEKSDQSHILVIDEIGKMEFFSKPFKLKIRDIFSPSSHNIVLATIPVRNSDPLIEQIRTNNSSKVWVITKANRNTIQEDIIKYLNVTLNLA